MVVDKYTHRLLNALGVEIDEYEEIKSYLQRGVEESFDKIVTMLGSEDLVKIYAIFHGMIVEFSKEDPKLRHIDTLREG